MHNAAIDNGEVWSETVEGHTLEFTETIRQEYSNCYFSAGIVEGHPVDTLYLKFSKEEREMLYLLRPDECAAIAWCLAGVLWSDARAKLPEDS